VKQMLAPFKNIYHRDDPGATIDVVQTPDEVVLYTNGKADATSKGDMATQKLLGQLPLLIRPEAEQVLLVGLGSGVTAGSVLTHPVKDLDVVEIAPAVIEASAHFAHVNRRPLADPRTHVHIDDASSHLRLSPKRYDVVISEPSNPWVAGIGNLFTTEFYQEVSGRLKPGGLMVQWFHTYEMDDATFRLVLRTFSQAFGHVALWQTEHSDVILVGSHAPLRLQGDAASARMAVPAVAEDLAAIQLNRLSTLLSLQMVTDEGVRRLAGPGPLNTEDRPILEYQAPKAFFTGARSYLHFGADERLKVSHADPDLLWMPQYLAQRGKGLTAEELEEIVAHQALWFPEVAVSNVRRVFLEAWIAQAPSDPRPQLQLVDWLRDRQRMPEARALVEGLLAARPQDVALLDMALDMEFASLPQQAGYLKRDEAAYRRMADRAARLRALQPQAEDGLDRRLAAIAFETGHLQEGYASIDRSARRAAGAERQALWLVAAQAAFDGRDYPVAVRYVKQILAEDGNHPGALNLGETLARKLKSRS
jgi:spermidine synthase